MGNLYVDTAAIQATAAEMEKLNKEMKDYFKDVKDAISILDNAWDGNTASKCIERLKKGNADIMNARYYAMDNYITFLKTKVSNDYQLTEDTNIKMSDQFK